MSEDKDDIHLLIELMIDSMIKSSEDSVHIVNEVIDAFINTRRNMTEEELRKIVNMYPRGLTFEMQTHVQELHDRNLIIIDYLKALKLSVKNRFEEYCELVKIQGAELRKTNGENYDIKEVEKLWIEKMDERLVIDEDIEHITRQISHEQLGDKDE